jgi:hypothetical protein
MCSLLQKESQAGVKLSTQAEERSAGAAFTGRNTNCSVSDASSQLYCFHQVMFKVLQRSVLKYTFLDVQDALGVCDCLRRLASYGVMLIEWFWFALVID